MPTARGSLLSAPRKRRTPFPPPEGARKLGAALRFLESALLGVVLLLAGCFPGPERVGELTLSMMQGRFRSDPQLKASGAEVVAVKVTGGSRTRYAAVASVRHDGKTYEVPVTVVLDGLNLEWFAEPTAFDFLTATKPATVSQIPR